MTSPYSPTWPWSVSTSARSGRDDNLPGTIRLGECPHCAAEYPAFHSPAGSLETLCDECGWSSEE